MNRKEILNELKIFKCVPGSDAYIHKLSDEKLELRLKLLKSMSEEADRELNNSFY